MNSQYLLVKQMFDLFTSVTVTYSIVKYILWLKQLLFNNLKCTKIKRQQDPCH